MSNTRIERDSMGELHVPEAALYGAQTQRAVDNFPVSHQRMPAQFIRALILAKAAAAKANVALGQISDAQGNAIVEATQILLAGDFIATSITRPYQTRCRRLQDCQRQLALKPSVKTFPSAFPAIRIDHCFVSPEIRIRAVRSDYSPLARVASDHLPLIIDFDMVAA